MNPPDFSDKPSRLILLQPIGVVCRIAFPVSAISVAYISYQRARRCASRAEWGPADRLARLQAAWRPVGRPESAPDPKFRAHSDANPVSTPPATRAGRFR